MCRTGRNGPLNWELERELTDASGVSETLNETNTQDFLEPFPSVYVLYSPNEKHSFSFDLWEKRCNAPDTTT